MANSKTIEIILKAIGEFSDVQSNISSIQKSLNQLKLSPELTQKFSKIFSDLEKQTDKYQKHLNSGFKSLGDVSGLEKSGKEIISLFEQLYTTIGKIDTKSLEESFKVDPSKVKELNDKLAQAKKEFDDISQSDAFKEASNYINTLLKDASKLTKSKYLTQFSDSIKTGNFEEANAVLQKLTENTKKFNDEGKKEEYKTFISNLSAAFEKLKSAGDLQSVIDKIKELKIEQENLNSTELTKFMNQFGLTKEQVMELSNAFRNFSNQQEKAAQSTFSLNSELSQIKNKATYFLGLTNAVFLFRRALSSALETVKELDAVMTETAVVTDFTVGDMWDKLPVYSKQATALGASIKDLYSATTLYYQQGLETNAAMGVGVETMKMARIANMDAADATTAMTAALRGFNMEVNELNAQKVNDVYSELAAITAADTNQIATAMGKTASIAASANMEFETTAALLAQIIETTQEAPETAGTAMKTIIARFTEVKELFSEGMLAGEDEEGEEININKIDAALKTVGISLKDFLNGSKGIDDIFLELASKWDGLDLATQRYIATMAAGSRQQSRFIAMMSNYDRTMELVTAANNSAGASQQQFDKTLESLEAKLQRLANAWQQFTMGLANNEIIKFGADALTFLLEGINKVIEGLSGGNGLTKSFITLQIAMAALSGARGLFNKLEKNSGLKQFIAKLKDIPPMFAQVGKESGEKLRSNLKEEYATAGEEAYQAGMNVGQKFIEGRDQVTQKEQSSIKVESVETAQTGAGQIDQKKEGDEPNINPDGSPSANLEKATEKTNALKAAFNSTSNAAHRTTGAITTLAGAGITLWANNRQAKDETDEFAAGLEAAGKTASIAGSAVSLLAPVLAAAGVAIGPVIIAVAALTAVIGAFAWASKNAYNKSLEGQMEAATKAVERAKTAAEEAKIAYDELLQNKAGYNELQSTLNELTRGTNEWKQALVEANQQVLQLLETYPELVQFMSREGGQLILEDAGWNYLENLLINQAQNTQRLYSASQMSELALGKELQYENLLNSVKDSLNMGSALRDQAIYSGNEVLSKSVERIFEEYQKTPEIFAKQAEISFGQFVENFKQADAEGQAQLIEQWNNSQLANKYGKINGAAYSEEASTAAGPGYFYGTKTNGDYVQINFDKEFDENINIYNNELSALAEETGFTTHELYSMREGLATYDSYLQIYGQKMQVYAENLLSYLDEPYQNSQYSQQVTTGLAKNFASRSATEIEEKKNNLLAEDENGNKVNIQNLAKQLNESGNYKIVDTTGSDKTYQEIYEQLTGASAEGLSRDVLANEISKIMVSEELSDSAQELIGRLDKLATKDEGTANQAAAIISQDVSGLNLGEISSLEKVDLWEIATQLEYDNIGQLAEAQEYKDKKITELDEADQLAAAQTYINQFTDEQLKDMGITDDQSMLEYMKQNEVVVTAGLQLQIDTKQFQDDLEAQREDITKGIDSIFEDGYTEQNLSGFSVQNLKNLTNQIAGMGKENGKEYIVQFQEIIAKSNLGEEQADQLATYLSNVDWSDMNEAVAAMDHMGNLGLDTSIIQSFWKTAVSGANTYMVSMNEVLSLTESLQGKMKKVGDIEKALAEGNASYDDMMQLVNAGVDISKFQLTPDGWKATADQIEAATDQVKLYNAEQARAVADQQREALNKAQEIWNRSVKGSQIKQLTSTNEDGTLAAGAIESKYQATSIATTLGLQQQAEGETLDEFIARIQEAYNSYIDLLNNGEDLQIIADKQVAMAEAAKYSATEGEYAEQGKFYMDENGNITQGEGTAARSDESLIYSVQAEAVKADLDVAELTNYAAQLQKVNKGLSDVNAAQIALANSKLNAGLREIIDSYGTWTKLIDKKSGLIKATSSDDVAAFEKLKTATNKMLNTTKDLSDAFWKSEKNMKNLKKVAEGDKEALEDLQKAAATDYLQNLDLQVDPEGLGEAKKAINDFTKYMDSIEIPKLEAGVEWQGQDAQKFIDNFNNMASAANLSADQIQNAVKSMGFDAEITYVKQTRKLPIYSQTEEKIDNGDGTATITSGTPVITRFEEVTGYFPVVKTLTATGAGGGGISAGNIEAGKANKTPAKKKKGGSKKSKKEKWENPYDKQYNTVQKINVELRKREQLERRYQNLLAKSNTTATDLSKNTQKQVAAVKKEMQYRNKLLDKRKDEMKSIEKKNKKYEKYAYYDEKEGRVVIDWNAINKIKDPEKGKKVEDYIKKLEEKDDQIKEQEDELEEQTAILREIYDQGKDEYFDLENQIKDALVDERQKEIDKLSAINDSINDTNTRLIDAMQSSIDKYRQDRENARTEEELSDKQRRLAYLRQDTSGANALEIMQLEKELEQGQEDYTDTLVDQKISELQQQNDEAAEQRERQIQIAQAQLDKWVESGEIWKNVYTLMGEGLIDAGVKPGSNLEKLLKDANSYGAMSQLQQEKWVKDLQNMATAALSWLENGLTTQALVESGRLEKGQKIDFTTSDGTTFKGATIQEDGTVKTEDGQVFKNVKKNYDGTWTTDETAKTQTSTTTTTTTTNTTTTTTPTFKKPSSSEKKGVGAAIYTNAEKYGWGNGETRKKRLKEVFGADNNIQSKYVNSSSAKSVDNESKYTYAKMKKKYKNGKSITAYATGGLADFTGPAWLDGTKSKPEYILDAEQTRSFFELVDVLGSLKGGINQNSQITGDSIYDVDINVESIGSDYDVEQLASTVKRMIVDDARYRNNNVINLSR